MDNTRAKRGYFLINNKKYIIHNDVNLIGRNKEAAVTLKEINISQHHALVVVISNKHYLSDVNSSNGTFLNSLKLEPLKLYEIKDGASVKFAETKCIYFIIKDDGNITNIGDSEVSQIVDESVYNAATQVFENISSPLNNSRINESIHMSDHGYTKLPPPMVKGRISSNVETAIHDLPTQVLDKFHDNDQEQGPTIHELPTQMLNLSNALNEATDISADLFNLNASIELNNSVQKNSVELSKSVPEAATGSKKDVSVESLNNSHQQNANDSSKDEETANDSSKNEETHDLPLLNNESETQIKNQVVEGELINETVHQDRENSPIVDDDNSNHSIDFLTMQFTTRSFSEATTSSEPQSQINKPSKIIKNIIESDSDSDSETIVRKKGVKKKTILDSSQDTDADFETKAIGVKKSESDADDTDTDCEIYDEKVKNPVDTALVAANSENSTTKAEMSSENIKMTSLGTNTSTDSPSKKPSIVDTDSDTDAEMDIPKENATTENVKSTKALRKFAVDDSGSETDIEMDDGKEETDKSKIEFESKNSEETESQLVKVKSRARKFVIESSDDTDVEDEMTEAKKAAVSFIRASENIVRAPIGNKELEIDALDDSDENKIEFGSKNSEEAESQLVKVNNRAKKFVIELSDDTDVEDEMTEDKKAADSKNNVTAPKSNKELETDALDDSDIIPPTQFKDDSNTDAKVVEKKQEAGEVEDNDVIPSTQNDSFAEEIHFDFDTQDLNLKYDSAQQDKRIQNNKSNTEESLGDSFNLALNDSLIDHPQSKDKDEEADVFLLATQKNLLEACDNSLNENESIFLKPTQKIQIENDDDDDDNTENIFLQQTQQIPENHSELSEEIFKQPQIIVTEKITDNENSIFSEATQKLPTEEDVFLKPGQVSSKRAQKAAGSSRQAEDDIFMQATQIADNKVVEDDLFMQATQIVDNDVKQQQALAPSIESQLEVMFATQTVKLTEDDEYRPVNPLGSLLSSMEEIEVNKKVQLGTSSVEDEEQEKKIKESEEKNIIIHPGTSSVDVKDKQKEPKKTRSKLKTENASEMNLKGNDTKYPEAEPQGSAKNKIDKAEKSDEQEVKIVEDFTTSSLEVEDKQTEHVEPKGTRSKATMLNNNANVKKLEERSRATRGKAPDKQTINDFAVPIGEQDKEVDIEDQQKEDVKSKGTRSKVKPGGDDADLKKSKGRGRKSPEIDLQRSTRSKADEVDVFITAQPGTSSHEELKEVDIEDQQRQHVESKSMKSKTKTDEDTDLTKSKRRDRKSPETEPQISTRNVIDKVEDFDARRDVIVEDITTKQSGASLLVDIQNQQKEHVEPNRTRSKVKTGDDADLKKVKGNARKGSVTEPQRSTKSKTDEVEESEGQRVVIIDDFVTVQPGTSSLEEFKEVDVEDQHAESKRTKSKNKTDETTDPKIRRRTGRKTPTTELQRSTRSGIDEIKESDALRVVIIEDFTTEEPETSSLVDIKNQQKEHVEPKRTRSKLKTGDDGSLKKLKGNGDTKPQKSTRSEIDEPEGPEEQKVLSEEDKIDALFRSSKIMENDNLQEYPDGEDETVDAPLESVEIKFTRHEPVTLQSGKRNMKLKSSKRDDQEVERNDDASLRSTRKKNRRVLEGDDDDTEEEPNHEIKGRTKRNKRTNSIDEEKPVNKRTRSSSIDNENENVIETPSSSRSGRGTRSAVSKQKLDAISKNIMKKEDSSKEASEKNMETASTSDSSNDFMGPPSKKRNKITKSVINLEDIDELGENVEEESKDKKTTKTVQNKRSKLSNSVDDAVSETPKTSKQINDAKKQKSAKETKINVESNNDSEIETTPSTSKRTRGNKKAQNLLIEESKLKTESETSGDEFAPSVSKRKKKTTLDTDSDELIKGKLATPSRKKTVQLQNTPLLGTPERLKRVLKPKVVFTMLDSPELESLIRSLGGSVVDSVEACTVLVTTNVKRSQKLLSAVGSGKPICSPKWLNECKKAGSFLDPWDHILIDEEAEKKWNFSLKESLRRGASSKLLENYVVHLIVSNAQDVLKGAIESCGGKCVTRATPKNSASNYVIVSTLENKSKYAKFLKQTPKPLVVTTEAIFDGVLRQELQFEKHQLS